MKKMIIKFHAKMLWLTGLTLDKVVKNCFSNNTLCKWKSNVIGKAVTLDARHNLNMFEE
jgi:hypothetical protein